MMLVHETSNFGLAARRPTHGSPQRFQRPADALDDGRLAREPGHVRALPTADSIQEWKHLAALGRDHEVKVVYAGFLMHSVTRHRS